MHQSPKPTIESEVLAARCAEICEDRKAENIVMFDVRKTSVLADFCIICSAASDPHIRAITGRLHHDLAQEGIYPRVEGESASRWVVLDYGPVLVHIMDPERREFYRLEELCDPEQVAYPSSEQDQPTGAPPA